MRCRKMTENKIIAKTIVKPTGNEQWFNDLVENGTIKIAQILHGGTRIYAAKIIGCEEETMISNGYTYFDDNSGNIIILYSSGELGMDGMMPRELPVKSIYDVIDTLGDDEYLMNRVYDIKLSKKQLNDQSWFKSEF